MPKVPKIKTGFRVLGAGFRKRLTVDSNKASLQLSVDSLQRKDKYYFS